jgi:hypothetical protein
MEIPIKGKITRKEVISLFRRARRQKRKKVDWNKFAGTVKLKEDPLKIQKRLRDEWE